MRDIGDGLYDPFEFHCSNFIQKQCKDNWCRVPKNDRGNTDRQCIFDESAKVIRRKEKLEVFKSDPWTSKDSLSGRKSLNAIIIPYMGL